jgi:hypothetical protein
MTVFSINDKVPVYCIFTFFLLIFADTTSNLFPCQLRRALENNLILKHAMVYLSITFLIVLLENIPDKSLYKIFSISFYLYVIFILISKTEYGFFIPILIITAVIYILYLKREELHKQAETASKKEKEEIEKKHDIIIKLNNLLIIVIFILTIIGFFIYMGRKKFEYKNNFNYLTFIFGKIECNGSPSKIDYLTSLKYLFK